MSDVTEIEAQIADLKELVQRKDLALRLEKVPEFKELILDGFCEKDCARFARNSGDPSIEPENRADSLAMAQAAGHLRRWLSMTVRQGLMAEQEIAEGQEALAELRAAGEGA